MGHRVIKRVPIDFSHPKGEAWDGYLNPHYWLARECNACGGSGYSPAAERYKNEWYGNAPFDPASTGSTPYSPDHPIVQRLAERNVGHDQQFFRRFHETFNPLQHEAARLCRLFNSQWMHHLSQEDADLLVTDERLWDFTRRPRTPEQEAQLAEQRANGGGYWLREPNGYRPTAAEVNEWSLQGMGHDSISQWVCVKARCARNGEPDTCERCGGEGRLWPSDEVKADYEGWAPTEPPSGPAWQLWETTSEGSPVSPVFATPEALANWCAENAAIFAREKLTSSQWLRMFLEDDTEVGSMVVGTEGYLGSVANLPL